MMLQIGVGKQAFIETFETNAFSSIDFRQLKNKNCMRNIQPLCHSTIDLDKAIAVATSKAGKRKCSFLQYLNHVKCNDLIHKKNPYQHRPKTIIIRNDDVAHMVAELQKEKITQHD